MPEPWCTYGGEPKPGQPVWFQFALTTLLEALGLVELPESAIGSWITLQWLGLPTGAIETATFCDNEPVGELASVDDLLGLANWPRALTNGSVERIKNSYLKWEYAQRCECRAAPGALNQSGTTKTVSTGNICQDASAANVVVWIGAPIPRVDAASMTLDAAVNCSAGPLLGLSAVPVDIGDTVVAGTKPYYGASAGGFCDLGRTDALNLSGLTSRETWYPYATFPGYGQGTCATAHLTYTPHYALPTDYPAPTPPSGYPTDYPLRPACPTVTDLQGLAEMICQLQELNEVLNGKLDYLAKLATPPTAYPELSPTAVETGVAVPKPENAVGVVVEVITIPTYVARYGTPAFYPDLGHVLLDTANGPLPSVLLKHNPLVLFFPNPQITSVTLDLSAGVEAQMRFLLGPR